MELVMVMLLVGILSVFAIPQFVDYRNEAKEAVTLEKLNALKSAIVGDARLVANGQYTKPGYEAHCLAPPTTLADLVIQPGAGTCADSYDPFTKRGWRGPYISNTDPNYTRDAWGNALEYFVEGPPARTLRSCGPDAVCGNADDISVTY